jgi:hypothetical protein
VGSRGSWELNLYDEIADAMREGGEEGGCKRSDPLGCRVAQAPDIGDWNGTMEEALMNEYIDLRRSQGKRPFIDAPHFEISE